jgi:glyoxylase-like metal-dependent hydrolase (beta-lactamase superfamily II)
MKTADFPRSGRLGGLNRVAVMTMQATRELDGLSPGTFSEVPEDIERIHLLLVNAYLVGQRGARDGDWVMVDAGLPFSAHRILRAAERRFGPNSRPRAIVLTHGHFDHVGAIQSLVKKWDVPVYAHELELPYLTGRSAYPPPDPTVGGGFMARSSFLYPRQPINLGTRVRALPADGSIPAMPGWSWMHTPGHSPGHVSLFRDSDRTLIVGDAFCNQKQESLLGTLIEHPEIEGPPKYFTIDWDAARQSVQRLSAMQPEVAVFGHGLPLIGYRLRVELDWLARNFDEVAVPPHGRYVNAPAFADEDGVVMVPPPVNDPTMRIAACFGLAAVAGIVFMAVRHRRNQLD